ncbi:MAG: hypothetical protein B7Z05_03420 [Thiotrichales bacterium 32-46-8]|nr:MAG: hypothetical protein B7Z05_03420 [Thiotrichales bacterium 32-46-8]
MKKLVALAGLMLSVAFAPVMAKDDPADKYPQSLLYDKPIKVAKDVYSAIGALQPYTYENSGHNNNLSFVIGEKGILVVNGSSSYLLAKALHDEIKHCTMKSKRFLTNLCSMSLMKMVKVTPFWVTTTGKSKARRSLRTWIR